METCEKCETCQPECVCLDFNRERTTARPHKPIVFCQGVLNLFNR